MFFVIIVIVIIVIIAISRVSDNSHLLPDDAGAVVNGYGKETYPDGKQYEGEFVNGLPEGKGTMKWPDGERYEGQWKNGQRNGYGVDYMGIGMRDNGKMIQCLEEGKCIHQVEAC